MTYAQIYNAFQEQGFSKANAEIIVEGITESKAIKDKLETLVTKHDLSEMKFEIIKITIGGTVGGVGILMALFQYIGKLK
jgi:hypothetical protein